jgi:hypothetical protein
MEDMRAGWRGCGKEPISRGNRWHTDCAVLASWVYYEGARLTSQSADFLNLFCFFSCGVKVSYDEPTNTITDTIDCDLVKTRPTKNSCVIVLLVCSTCFARKQIKLKSAHFFKHHILRSRRLITQDIKTKGSSKYLSCLCYILN